MEDPGHGLDAAWSARSAPGTSVIDRPVPETGFRSVSHERAGGMALPPQAALVGLAGFAVGAVLSFSVRSVADPLALPDALVLVMRAVALWSGLLGACSVASRRYGTGSLTRDYGLRFDRTDVRSGLFVGAGARIVAGLAVAPFFLAGPTFRRGNVGLEGLGADVAALGAFTVVVVLGAPVVEELFFRGLLQRSFYTVLGAAGAVGVQAFLFGLVHITPELGMANFTVMAATGAAGVVFGIAARNRRLPTSMVGHAVFNGVVVMLVLAGLALT